MEFLQIKQQSSEPVYSFIDTFEKQDLRSREVGFQPNCAITRKSFMDGLLPNIRGKLQEGARSRTTKTQRRAKHVLDPDGHLLESYGKVRLNLEMQLVQEDVLEKALQCWTSGCLKKNDCQWKDWVLCFGYRNQSIFCIPDTAVSNISLLLERASCSFVADVRWQYFFKQNRDIPQENHKKLLWKGILKEVVKKKWRW